MYSLFNYSIRSRPGPRAAFTLIELLTVIAIIGILAAILIPVVGKVRDSAARANCVSNLRQIGTGIHLFADDHGGRMPGPYHAPILHSTTGTAGATKHFTNDMADYYQEGASSLSEPTVIDILVSPTFRRRFGSDEEIRNGLSYRLNTADELFGNNSSGALPNPLLLHSIENPTMMWMVIDVDRTIYVPGGYTIAPAPLHGSTRNVLYVDGHVGTAPSNIRPRRGEFLQ
jgi:prepilin-type N-terminal cleavage/methylation domain-containing protein/prepilin-type processing-associated H-X9-DG protein